jgi:hypothetical protein
MKTDGDYCSVPSGNQPSRKKEGEMSDKVIIYGKAG